MDPEILRTAILDRARAKLGLPSREALAIEREKRAREEALQASNLETADVLRQRTRMDIETQPALRQAQQEAAVARAEAAKAAAERDPRVTPHYVEDAAGNVTAITALPDGTYRKETLGRIGKPQAATGGPGQEPKTGWQAQYDQNTGQLLGYYHPATNTFRKAGEGNLPGGTGPKLGDPEREKRGLLQTMLSDAQRLQQIIGPADKPTEAGQKIGYWSGREQDVRASGMLASLGVEAPPPDVLEMTHISDNLSDMLLRARSGAQINEQEYQRLRKIMPNSRSTPEAFRSNLSRFIVEANNLLAARQGQGTNQPGLGYVPVSSHGGAAPTAPAAPAASVEKWVRDASGKLVRAQ